MTNPQSPQDAPDSNLCLSVINTETCDQYSVQIEGGDDVTIYPFSPLTDDKERMGRKSPVMDLS